jgi:ferredoxin
MPVLFVWIEDGCISCGLCESICSEVFEMPDEAIVKENADLNTNENCIKEAVDYCPIEVIHFEES